MPGVRSSSPATIRNGAIEASSLRLLGEIEVWHEPPEIEQAEAHYRQALALAEELGMRPFAGTLPSWSWYPLRQERPGGTGACELTAAIELYRAMEMTFWLPQAEAALAQVSDMKLCRGRTH